MWNCELPMVAEVKMKTNGRRRSVADSDRKSLGYMGSSKDSLSVSASIRIIGIVTLPSESGRITQGRFETSHVAITP
jgi:hypothetical protein